MTIDADALLTRLAKTDATALCDADKAIPVVDGAIRRLVGTSDLLGRAQTVVAHEDHLPVLIALETLRPGDVLVVATNGGRRAVLGELFTSEAKRRGAAGIVIDGFCRDLDGLRRLDIPVFARGTNPASGTMQAGPSHGAPVVCGGVLVTPGDLVIGGADGLVIASPTRVAAALDLAEEITRLERQVLAAIDRGTPLDVLTNVKEHLAALSRGESSALALLPGGADVP